MVYFLILRSHYYGPRTGPWQLATDEEGEPVTFDSRDEAVQWTEEWGFISLTRSEYARDYKLIEGTVDSEAIHVERRVSSSRPR